MHCSPLASVQPNLTNHSLLKSPQCTLYILVYGDDVFITGCGSGAITNLIRDLNKGFTLKDLEELDYFLGIQVTYLPNGTLHLSQK